MTALYSTKNSDRKHGIYYDTCEFCGLEAKESIQESQYYELHGLILCMFGSFPYEKVEEVANTWTIKS